MSLAGKTAIVTGASSGIGAEISRRLAGAGCNVAVAARREDRLRKLAEELGPNVLPVPTDVTDPGACAALAARTLEHFGSPDILVNNAGIGLYGSIADGDPEDWRKMFDVNVLGALYTTRAALRHMLESGSGDVVFVSSIAGRRVPRVDATVYAATKHAVNAIAEGLRMDLSQKGLRIINVEPGLVKTEFPENTYPNAQDFYADKDYVPLEPENIAEAVLYAVLQPPNVSINEVLIRPTGQTR